MLTEDEIVEIGARRLHPHAFEDQRAMASGSPARVAKEARLQAMREQARHTSRVVLAALHAAGLVLEQGWRFDMENAPRDGTWFIAWFSGAGGYEIISWQTLPGTDEYAWRRSNFMLASNGPARPIAWRALPAPPTDSKGAA